jgi:hypothetical protein
MYLYLLIIMYAQRGCIAVFNRLYWALTTVINILIHNLFHMPVNISLKWPDQVKIH